MSNYESTGATRYVLKRMRDRSGRVITKRVAVSGLDWQGIGYGKQWFALADDSAQSFRYADEAVKVAQAKFAQTPSAEFVLVTFDALGRNPTVTPFSTSQLANEAYNDVIDAPGSRAYAAVIDREGGAWNEWFGATVTVYERWFTKEKLKQLAPWLIGGAVLIAGAIYYSKKRKRAPGRRRRRGAFWRRRTVTTWR